MKKEYTNCPNCGAPIAGPVCEYCDTRFDIRAVVAPDVTEIRLKQDFLRSAVETEKLFNAAIMALRNSCITPNEARRLLL